MQYYNLSNFKNQMVSLGTGTELTFFAYVKPWEEKQMEFIVNTIFWTLALYGLFEIIKNIIYISTYTKFKSDGIYLIIAVKNQENKIEGFLRASLFKILYGKEEYLKDIIVADLKSTDKTKEIAKKLTEEYDCLRVLSWKECKDLMDNVDES